ncbi:type I-C CRISPR-associated endonuclease Cas1 [Pikeienuella piscinae]|uniref:CRISPR-associated endonuclease Cas1 n=1 Tax=Pikeienuella piscinae TaxID=2748098 RepID=A0A7L5C0N7_9RHOB|nr:type I-C CRISPR-associated endonuclease Cas1c [Pikeienuella piscinae]QIE56658.1 type I-C CRISPR-associated endonuclease Cas1 [Pikeienuella piscinae]
MKKLLNTLYVTTDGAWLRKEGANVVVEMDGAERGRAPVHLLGSIVTFGAIGLSPALIGFCAEEAVAISLMSRSGRFLARVEGPQGGNVLLRRAQHEATRDAPLAVARAVVAAKSANQRGVLRRHLRDHAGDDTVADTAVEDAERRLSDTARKALDAPDLDKLRGLEGEGANAYFGVFDHLIRAPEMAFVGRSRRPPKSRPNAVLSFLYSLLVQDCRAAAEGVGLDPQMGFLHRDRPGRPSLALDLMEEFRAPLADRLCLTLLNRRQLAVADFREDGAGGVFLTDDGRRTVLTTWQERKRVRVKHPFLHEDVEIGLLPHLQAQLLARHLRGDLDGYPAYVWR